MIARSYLAHFARAADARPSDVAPPRRRGTTSAGCRAMPRADARVPFALALALAAATAGCDPFAPAACPAPPSPRGAQVCIDLDPAWATAVALPGATPGGPYGGEATFAAEMVGPAAAADAATCGGKLTVPAGWHSAFWRVRDAQARTGVLGFATPNPMAFPATATALEVHTLVDAPSWTPVSATAVRAAGALRFFVLDGSGGNQGEKLAAPDVTFALGDETCGGSDSCGDWRGHDARVTASGVTVTAHAAEITRLGALEIQLGEWVTPVGSTSCEDWDPGARRWLVYAPASP